MINYKRKIKMISFLLLISLLVSVTFTGCDSYENFRAAFIDKDKLTEETVRIGVYEPLSGPDEDHGELEKRGIELANKLFPTALGKRVELLYFDNKSDIYIAETMVQEMIDKRVAVVLGSYGSVNSLMAVEKLEAASIPAITITNTNPLVTSFNPFYFRVSYTDAFQGIGMAKYAVEGMEVTGAAILKPLNDDFGIAVAKSFSDKFKQLTGNEDSILASEDYISGQEDYTEKLKAISESGATVVFLPADIRDASTILTQAAEMGLNLTFLGTDQWDSEKLFKLDLKGGNIELVFSTLFDSKIEANPLSEAFVRAYEAEFGEGSEPESASALAFDAYLIAIDAINRAGTALNGDKIREALTLTSQFKGASGTISFNEQGDPIKSVTIMGVKNGKAESIFLVEPTWVVQGTEAPATT